MKLTELDPALRKLRRILGAGNAHRAEALGHAHDWDSLLREAGLRAA